jgi:hypothetical protein
LPEVKKIAGLFFPSLSFYIIFYIIEEVCRDLWVRYSLKKNMAGKNRRGQGLYRTLGWSRNFLRVDGCDVDNV